VASRAKKLQWRVPDSPRSYPKELADHTRASWPAGGRRLPDRLETILDAAYHASFLRDEERNVTCRILVLPASELPGDGGPPASLLPLVFDTPRGFDEHELRRLSPAANMPRALVGVDDSGDALTTWGLVQSGPRWLQASQGGRAKEPPMPACLVVRVARPGHLVVACGSQLVAELRGGRLTDFTLDVFQSRWLPALFADARESAADEHRMSSTVAVSTSVARDLARYVAQQMIKRVVATMRATHHGGTLVIGSPDCIAENYLRTKYPLQDAPGRRRFRALVMSILATMAQRAIATGEAPDAHLYRIDTDPHVAELDEGLFEMSHLIAALADVDGAVVLTRRFEILGFGAEIASGLPPVEKVRRALDLEGDTFATEVVDAVGTRHRSAYRFCAAVPHALAIVVSQDGDVRFVTRHRGEVTYWKHGAGDG
jgi:hypothetical protein